MAAGDDNTSETIGARKDKIITSIASERAISDPEDVGSKKAEVRENVERYAQLFSADEDAFDQPTTTRKELWSYYLYYNGDNGVGPGSYSQTL